MGQTPDNYRPKKFEPPPWERAQFEELERSRAEAREEEELAAALSELEVQATPEESPDSEAAPEIVPEDTAGAGESGPRQDPLTDPRIEAMFLELSVSEQKAGADLWKIGLFGSLVLACIGAMLLVWGVVAAVRTSGSGGMVGASVLIAFGTGFVALAAWMTIRSLRQRGAH